MANKPDELQTASAEQQLHTAESTATPATGDTVITDRHGPKVETVVSTNIRHKRGGGFGTTNFDDAALPPHLRAKISDDPTGAKNKELHAEHRKKVEADAKKAEAEAK